MSLAGGGLPVGELVITHARDPSQPCRLANFACVSTSGYNVRVDCMMHEIASQPDGLAKPSKEWRDPRPLREGRRKTQVPGLSISQWGAGNSRNWLGEAI